MSSEPPMPESPAPRVQPMQVVAYLDTIAEHRAVPGVISLAQNGDVLYMNAEADMMDHEIGGGIRHVGGARICAPSILELCGDLQRLLTEQGAPQNCHTLELRRVAGSQRSSVLLRGFLVPDVRHHSETRLLVIMERIGRERRVIPAEVKERFNLTDREEEIVQHIADGQTNKEIASALSISEHTVKEHVRHLLKKTKTTTRTAILAQIFQDANAS